MAETTPKQEPPKQPDSLYDIPGVKEAVEENIRKKGKVWEEEKKEPKKPEEEK